MTNFAASHNNESGLLLSLWKVIDVHHLFEVFQPLLIVYGIFIPAMVACRFFLNRQKEIVYTMTDRRGYKMLVTLEFKMSRDERYEVLREIGLRPLEYKTKHLPPGVFKVEILNAHDYDNAI